ncbi:MAG: RpiB/LacA/LacB family sugar-phosphate isomerase [Candidatus Zambryskibacteria bacterium]|nr:RpiB/LacA/LacB family sugar-phosphate isomerase [Candidatus Zambryskibacteria bacterium]
MKIYLASDHAGFQQKEVIKKYLGELSYEVEDMGAHNETPEDDYPEIMARAARKVSENPNDNRAIIFGGSGQGEAMVANRFQGVRATVFYGGPLNIITLSREHNDANILSFGARFVGENEAKEATKLWLETKFTGDERHMRRIKQIENI